MREIKERPAGPIREGKFGARALSLDDSPLRYIHTEFQYKLPADFEFLNSRIRTRQNRGEYLECRCPNRTGAAIVKIEFGRLSEFPDAADPPVSRSSRILKSCMILKYESDHKPDI